MLGTSIAQDRRSRADKGKSADAHAKHMVLSFVKSHPEYLGMGNRHKDRRKKDIAAILGLAVSASTVNRWIREG